MEKPITKEDWKEVTQAQDLLLDFAAKIECFSTQKYVLTQAEKFHTLDEAQKIISDVQKNKGIQTN